ncbi:MAG TPA: hypothetical protein VJT31_40240, partial [Rugosimonospora sp.]|nr:hypothetical protein [Rugosimonospora sp.]
MAAAGRLSVAGRRAARTVAGGIGRDQPARAARAAQSDPGPGWIFRDVAGHSRNPGGGLHSIRVRLLLPVAVATVGLVALGTVQAMQAIRLANESNQAATMAATATATVQLAHRLETEITEEDALRQRGGAAGASLVTAARGQTDLAVDAFHQAGV